MLHAVVALQDYLKLYKAQKFTKIIVNGDVERIVYLEDRGLRTISGKPPGDNRYRRLCVVDVPMIVHLFDESKYFGDLRRLTRFDFVRMAVSHTLAAVYISHPSLPKVDKDYEHYIKPYEGDHYKKGDT